LSGGGWRGACEIREEAFDWPRAVRDQVVQQRDERHNRGEDDESDGDDHRFARALAAGSEVLLQEEDDAVEQGQRLTTERGTSCECRNNRDRFPPEEDCRAESRIADAARTRAKRAAALSHTRGWGLHNS